MSGLTLAIVKKGTGKYAVLRKYDYTRIYSVQSFFEFFKENKRTSELIKKQLYIKDGCKLSLFLYYFYSLLDYLKLKDFDASDLHINKRIEIEYDGIMYYYEDSKLFKEEIRYEDYGETWDNVGYKYIDEQRFDCFNSALKAAQKVFEARKEDRKDSQFEVVHIITEDLQ